MFCGNCGTNVGNGRYCPNCGSAVNVTNEESSPTLKAKMNNKVYRAIAIAIAVVLILIIFIMVFPRPVRSANDIKKDLQNSEEFIRGRDLAISNFSVARRKTNRSKIIAEVYVDVVAENDSVEYHMTYYLGYSLYNSGWLLDQVSPVNEDRWTVVPIAGPGSNTLAEYVDVSQISDSNVDLENGYATYKYREIFYPNDGLVEEKDIDYQVSFRFDTTDAEWKYLNSEMYDSFAKWDIEGLWYANPSEYVIADDWCLDYVISISGTSDPSVFMIKVYDYENKKIYYEDEITLDLGGGYTDDISPTNDVWDKFYVYITNENIGVRPSSEFNTRGWCNYVKKEYL